MATAAAGITIKRSEAAESGFALMMEQLLRQSLEDSEERRRRARTLRGSIAMSAVDYDQTVTIEFAKDYITILDGSVEPLDASIAAPYRTLMALIQGDESPLAAHIAGRIRVRSSFRKPFFPLHVHNLMKLERERQEATRGIIGDVAAAAIVGTALVAVVAIVFAAP